MARRRTKKPPANTKRETAGMWGARKGVADAILKRLDKGTARHVIQAGEEGINAMKSLLESQKSWVVAAQTVLNKALNELDRDRKEHKVRK